jgi:phosphoglucomutase
MMSTSVIDSTQAAALLQSCQGHLSASALESLKKWLTDAAFAEFRAEIAEKIHAGAWTDLEDSFYTVLPFGTGGRRGPRGLGPNRINRRTIAESARGLANWVVKQAGAQSGGIVIAFDTRHGSTEFSQVCARAIAAAGIQVYLFDSFRPTPELSFAVRHLKASAGIVVSASHNPPTDNGFKAYGTDGGQLVPPHDTDVMEEVSRVSAGAIPLLDFEEGRRSGSIRIIGAEVDAAYQNALSSVLLTQARNVRLVYTPLHGVGAVAVLPALERAGFRDVHIVEAQSFPSGDFPNVPDHIPNPEVVSALQRAKELAEKVDADLAIATDPDADRLGCVIKRVRDGVAEWAPMNGNQMGAVLSYFVFQELHAQGRLPAHALAMKTTVTTDLVTRIAKAFHVGFIPDLLVGFKYIACVIQNIDDPDRFIFGTEESLGYLSRPYTRDKDGMNAALLLSEAVALWKKQGKDLWGLLDELYRRFGYFSEHLENYLRPGKTGQQEIKTMLDQLRERPPHTLAGLKVTEIVDRLTDEVRDTDGKVLHPYAPIQDPKTGKVIAPLMLAKDNLLVFHLADNGAIDGAKVAIRPSGTEPKCKFYIACHRQLAQDAGDAAFAAMQQQVDAVTLSLRDAVMQEALSRVDAQPS